MDWLSKKNWDKEDKLYSPKRTVNNKGSRTFEHIIGSLPSKKMDRHIPYESLWGEALFYYILELDRQVVRYYPQPVEVPTTSVNKDLIIRKTAHVPDTLIFRQGSVPLLFQVKGGDTFIEQSPHIYSACIEYCRERKWRYSIVRPKTLPKVVKDNILFIMHYRNPRPGFNMWIPEVLKKSEFFNNPTIIYLAKSFMSKADYRDILPVIYHLIFLGKLKVNICEPLNEHSVVVPGDLSHELKQYIEMGSDCV